MFSLGMKGVKPEDANKVCQKSHCNASIGPVVSPASQVLRDHNHHSCLQCVLSLNACLTKCQATEHVLVRICRLRSLS